ncbi:MAG: class I SAM-dependent methyltransferase [Flavobacteriales bacterium]
MELLTPTNWKDYELIDTGGFEKLERFGKYIISRPEPQAVWNKSLPRSEWEKLAHARFEMQIEKTIKPGNHEDKGRWILKSSMPQQWNVAYNYKGMHLVMRLGLTSFKHVGIFPEQAANWDFIYDSIETLGGSAPKVLNLFAYTGGASLAAKAAGADVTHVDSVKQVVNWTRENMELSNLNGIRWVVEDALKFVNSEVKRGKKYQGIILDPPAYGRGANGEKWHLDKNINEMLKLCGKLLEDRGFLILNLYSMGLSALIAENLVKEHFNPKSSCQTGELYQQDKVGKKLPLGVFVRFLEK